MNPAEPRQTLDRAERAARAARQVRRCYRIASLGWILGALAFAAWQLLSWLAA